MCVKSPDFLSYLLILYNTIPPEKATKAGSHKHVPKTLLNAEKNPCVILSLFS